jgi:hypothetical protein
MKDRKRRTDGICSQILDPCLAKHYCKCLLPFLPLVNGSEINGSGLQITIPKEFSDCLHDHAQ